MQSSSRLELSGEEFRVLVAKAADRIAHFVDSLPERPAASIASLSNEVVLPENSMPEKAHAYEPLLDQIFGDFLSTGLENAGPGNMAYVPGGGILHVALADMITAALNRYMPVWALSPAQAKIEKTVLQWFMDMVGFPATARGILTSGSSLATFSAILAARHKYLGEDLANATFYTSEIGHYSIGKAAMMAGVPARGCREIPIDNHFRMPADALRAAIRRDREAGLRPFLIVATAGATRNGAIDDLNEIARVAREENVWLHVDAAYGGFFMLTERGKALLTGIEHADSVALDPHKSLFIPYGCGALLVRDGDALRAAHHNSSPRYSDRQADPDTIDFCEYSSELSREWRGLRIWLPLMMEGVAPFRENLDEKLDLAVWAAEQLQTIPNIEIFTGPCLSVVTFRFTKPDMSPQQHDHVNRQLLDSVNARQRVHLMGVILQGQFVLRICVLSFRTHREHVSYAIEDIKAAVESLPA